MTYRVEVFISEQDSIPVQNCRGLSYDEAVLAVRRIVKHGGDPRIINEDSGREASFVVYV